MKKLILYVIAGLLFASCNNHSDAAKETADISVKNGHEGYQMEMTSSSWRTYVDSNGLLEKDTLNGSLQMVAMTTVGVYINTWSTVLQG